MTSKRRLALRGSLVLSVLGILALLASYLASGPDLELAFSRELRSTASVEQLDAAWKDLRAWPSWFHSLGSARRLDGPGHELEPGQELELKIDPKKGERKRFTLHARVLEYVPQKKLSLRITYDSKQRLTQLFDRIDWHLELNSSGDRVIVLGQAQAHTSHWRSRFFGRIADKILMNQVFYPDLFRLAKLNEPKDDSLPPIH